MESIFERIDNRKALLSLIAGMFCALGVTIKMSAEVTIENTPTMELMNDTMLFVRNFALSISAARVTTTLLAIVIGLLIYLGWDIRVSKKERISMIILSIIFAISQLLAYALKRYGFTGILWFFPICRVRTLAKLIALAVVFYKLLKVFIAIVRARFLQDQLIERKITFRAVGLCTILMLLAWSPYFFIFYPGTSNEDTVIQLMEVYEIPSYIQKMSAVQGPDIFITNHHPYATTMLFYAFFKLGLKFFGDINKGVAVYTILHMLFLATTFSVALQYLRYIGVTKKRTRAVQLLLMFYPMFPLYSVCMVKDTLYSAFCLYMILFMNEVARTKGEIFKLWWFDLIFAVDAFLMMITKNYGFYVMALIMVFYLIKYRKKWAPVLASCLIPLFIYKVIYIGMLLPALGVAPGGIQEALSVPFQQTARYVSEYGDEVTEEEKRAIKKVLPYNKLASKYNPELADPVKKKYNQEATDKELKNYFKVWAKMGLKHPLLYIEATLNNTYQYWDINKVSNLQYYEWNTYLQRHDPDGQYTNLYVENKYNMGGERYGIMQLVIFLQKVPILNIFSSLGLLPWLIIMFILMNWYRGRKGYNLALMVPILTYAVCFVSPDNGNSRYVMPIIFALPYLFMMELLPVDQQEEPTEMQSESENLAQEEDS